MGRHALLVLVLFTFTACESAEFSACRESEVVLLPHHSVVEDYILELYASVDADGFEKIIVISPNHFLYGSEAIAEPSPNEHGYWLHEAWAQSVFPDVPIEGWMLLPDASSETLAEFAAELAQEENALLVFSIDFSHYLPGEIAYVHDVRSIDVIESRSTPLANTLEVDSPSAVELLLRVLEEKNLTLDVLKNTNPSLDTDYDTFENTTHLFGCSREGEPDEREVWTQMFYAEPREWYLGLTEEDRYLYGTDESFFDQGGSDRAVILRDGVSEELTFDYF